MLSIFSLFEHEVFLLVIASFALIFNYSSFLLVFLKSFLIHSMYFLWASNMVSLNNISAACKHFTQSWLVLISFQQVASFFIGLLFKSKTALVIFLVFLFLRRYWISVHYGFLYRASLWEYRGEPGLHQEFLLNWLLLQEMFVHRYLKIYPQHHVSTLYWPSVHDFSPFYCILYTHSISSLL